MDINENVAENDIAQPHVAQPTVEPPRNFPAPISSGLMDTYSIFCTLYVTILISISVSSIICTKSLQSDIIMLGILLFSQISRMIPSLIFGIPRRHLVWSNRCALTDFTKSLSFRQPICTKDFFMAKNNFDRWAVAAQNPEPPKNLCGD
jgi:hypothetical protein